MPGVSAQRSSGSAASWVSPPRQLSRAKAGPQGLRRNVLHRPHPVELGVQTIALDEALHPEAAFVDRRIQHSVVADAQAQPRGRSLHGLDVEIRRAAFQPKRSPLELLVADDSASASSSPKASSREVPRSPLAISSSATRIEATCHVDAAQSGWLYVGPDESPWDDRALSQAWLYHP
jgi:hypothetical protein